MKYLVTWNYNNDPDTWCGGCRYYENKLDAYTDYQHFKNNTNFRNVHFLEVKEGNDNDSRN